MAARLAENVLWVGGDETVNVIDEPAHAAIQAELAGRLAKLKVVAGGL